MPPRRPVRAVRKDWEDALNTATLNREWLPCVENPIPFTELRQSPEEAEDLCWGCPLIAICAENAQALKVDKEVRGGAYWVKGKAVKSIVLVN